MDFDEVLDCGKLLATMLFLGALLLNCGGVEVTDVPANCWVPEFAVGSNVGVTDAGKAFACTLSDHVWHDGGQIEAVGLYDLCCVH